MFFKSEGFNVSIISYASLPICLLIENEPDENKIRETYKKAKISNIDISSFSLDEEDIDLGGKFDKFVEPSLIKKEFLFDFLAVRDLQINI